MKEFWEAWARREAESQWKIYRSEPAPLVEKVEADPDRCAFVVTFFGGERFEVRPSGIAKPMRLL